MKRYHAGLVYQRQEAEAEARRNSPRGKAGQKGGWVAARTYPASQRPRGPGGRFASKSDLLTLDGADIDAPIASPTSRAGRAGRRQSARGRPNGPADAHGSAAPWSRGKEPLTDGFANPRGGDCRQLEPLPHEVSRVADLPPGHTASSPRRRYSLTAAGQLLGLKRTGVAELIESERLAYGRTGGGAPYVTRAAIEVYARELVIALGLVRNDRRGGASG